MNHHEPSSGQHAESASQSVLSDESAIRQLAAMFSDAAARNDMDLFRRLWTADAVWEIGDPNAARAQNVDAIVSMMEGLMGRWEFLMTHSGVITVAGDRATARFITQEFARGKDSALAYNNLAMYDDQLLRDADGPGGWRFARRSYHYIWLDDSPIPGRGFALPPLLGKPHKS